MNRILDQALSVISSVIIPNVRTEREVYNIIKGVWDITSCLTSVVAKPEMDYIIKIFRSPRRAIIMALDSYVQDKMNLAISFFVAMETALTW